MYIITFLQVLRAQNVVDTVPSLTNLQGFGFSLSSGIDVDGNEFNGEYNDRIHTVDCLKFQ